MSKILEVEGLRKSYGHFALQNICFSLEEGCITGFIGINGAGKTTTIRTLLGLSPREAGSVRFYGRPISSQDNSWKDRLGVVLDGNCFYDELTLQEMKNILAPAYSHWQEKDFRTCLDRFGLSARQKISTLSKGMRAKFALALALSHQAELLIMDEPTSGLDPLIRSELMDILHDFMQTGGRGILFSTHILSDLDKVADSLILIDHGEILLEADKDALLDGHRLVKGDRRDLTPALRQLFLHLQETEFGFAGLTNQPQLVRQQLADAMLERPTLEDIMLGYIQPGKEAEAHVAPFA